MSNPTIMSKVELWGGIECTVNRVENTWYDQVIKTGHEHRISDLDLLAGLGLKKVRYPVIWERIAPDGLSNADWTWTDKRLNRLRELGITPIVGLVHHGSGPEYTSLIDPAFPEKLKEFAIAVATRYPWIKEFTPVNEPLTTARFSGLYGLWYPHGKNDSMFARALLNQCKATIEVMRAIKKINPDALLIQTEDLGKTFSGRKLAYQARFENERRWLTFDILSGKLNPKHIFWKYFKWTGIESKELNYFRKTYYTPDIIGINYYITSERYLDCRINKYPVHMHGGNRKHVYVDIEAVRVRKQGAAGLAKLLKETHKRYPQAQLAVTEVHLGCTRDEQLRWLKEAWETCNNLKTKGIPLVAMTAWSLFGAYNWNVLLTKDENHYEPGAFDLRSGTPRITALGKLITDLATERNTFDHETLKTSGWWKRDERLLFSMKNGLNRSVHTTRNEQTARPVLISGGGGTLGKAFARICQLRNIPYHLLTREEMDINDHLTVNKILKELNPWAVINAAGYVKVDDAEFQKVLCIRENVIGPASLAMNCRNKNVKFITFSSDLVFDGSSERPYMESHQTRPINIYGHSKKQAEERILTVNNEALIIRTSAFFGPWDENNFITRALRHIHKGQVFLASSENIVSPTYIPDLVNASLDLLIDGESGIWHLSNPSEITWADFAITTAKVAGYDHSLIQPCTQKKIQSIAGRPKYSALGSERGLLLPSLENAIHRYVRECAMIN